MLLLPCSRPVVHHGWAIVPQYIEQFRIVLFIFKVSAPTIQRDCPSNLCTTSVHASLSNTCLWLAAPFLRASVTLGLVAVHDHSNALPSFISQTLHQAQSTQPLRDCMTT